ncbi:glycosyltransferase [Enterobacteriaceae bacterium]
MKNFNVIFISGSHGIYGGGQVYLDELNKSLISKGIKSVILASDEVFSSADLICRIDTWKYKFINLGRLIAKLNEIDPARRAKIITNDITLSMFTGLLKLAGWEVYPLIHMSLFNTSKKSLFIKLLYPSLRAFFIRLGAKKILSVNKENLDILGKKCKYIGNFTINSWKETKFENKDIDFLYVGRFDIEKQPEEFIKLMHGFKSQGLNFKAVMVGSGTLTSAIEGYIEEYKLSDCVYLTGFLDKNIILSIYERSKLLLITSKTEGLPTVILDAATRNVEFISPALGSIPHLNSKWGVGYVVQISDMGSFIADNWYDLLSSSKNAVNLERFSQAHHIDAFTDHFLKEVL